MRDDVSPHVLPVLALLIAGLYLLLHPYQGLVHDARLYTLQALNHLRPDLYGNDVFLRYGSQDSYTLFTPLYATAISFLDTEPAASLITFGSALTLIIAAWWLARTLMPASLAWLSVGLLLVTPGYYGSGMTFAVLEGFITPRLLAEALVLLSLTAWLRGRPTLSIALILAGVVIHPIMAFPAVILLVLMSWGLRSWRRLGPLLLATAFVALVSLVGWLPISRWQFDAAWWPMAERVPHLVIEQWTSSDWARVSTILVTLGIAALHLSSIVQRLAVGLLATCVLTLLLSWIGGDLLKLVLVVQGQAWRSLWLATTIASLLLPYIATFCWRGPPLLRCSLLLLVTAWLLGHTSLALYFSIPALIIATFSNASLPGRWARLATLSAGILLIVAILCLLALAWSEHGFTRVDADATAVLRQVRAFTADGVLPCTLLLGIWYAAISVRSRTSLVLLTLATIAPVLVVATAAAKPWVDESYPREAREAFAGWRLIIPPGNDVLWATEFVQGGDPTASWLLLERPSYFSSVQVNSGLFSRPAAIELDHRGNALPLSLPTEMPIKIRFEGKEGEPPSCSDIPVRYIVTRVAIPDARVVSAPAELGPPFDQLQLRICP